MPAEFEVKLRKVGNGLIVSIPVPAYRGLRWKEGDILRLIVQETEITLTKAKAN